MSLQESLDEFKKQASAVIPAEAMVVMDRAENDLRNSGIMDQVLKSGEKAPEFSLPDTHSKMVESADLLQKGPLVVGFYRGVW